MATRRAITALSPRRWLLTASERALIFRPGGQLEPGRPGGNSPVSHIELGAQRCLVEQGLHLDIACTSFNCGLCHRSCTISRC